MKYTILQIAKSFVCLTPVSVEKSKSGLSSRGKGGILSGLLGGMNNKAVFGATKIFSLPDELYGTAVDKPKELTDFLIDCAQQSEIELKEIIFCPEGDELITKEYQHMPAKKKFLNSFAVLETEPMVNDKVENYSVISCEYGEEYGKTHSEMLNAVLYAMNNSVMNAFKDALLEKGIKLVRITPPTIALINAAKYDINSVEKTIALLSVDYVGVRLVVVNHGAPIYSQYFASPMAEIAEIFGRDQGMGTAESINMIKSVGIGVADKCFPQTAGKIKDILETFVSEIVRNLRMVLMSQRMQLDHMYISDALESMNKLVEYISDYMKNSGLSDHAVSVKEDILNPSNVPALDDTAEAAGFDSASFYLFSNMITYCDGIDDNMLFGIGTVKKRNVNIGKYACYCACIAMAVYMAVYGAFSIYVHIRKKNDDNKLGDTRYVFIQKQLDDRANLQRQIKNADSENNRLPDGTYTYVIVPKVINDLRANGADISSINFVIDDDNNTAISVSYKVASYNKGTELRNIMKSKKEYKVLISHGGTQDTSDGSYTYNMALSINKNEFKLPKKENDRSSEDTSSQDSSDTSSDTESTISQDNYDTDADTSNTSGSADTSSDESSDAESSQYSSEDEYEDENNDDEYSEY